MKYFKILVCVILVLTLYAIKKDYSHKNDGTSILFKGDEFPYGVQPKVYGKELHLFVTKENFIIIGENQILHSGNRLYYIKRLKKFAHSKDNLIVQFEDDKNNINYMRLNYKDSLLFFSICNEYEITSDDSSKIDDWGYNLNLMPLVIVIFYLSFIIPSFQLFLKCKNLQFVLLLFIVNLLVLISSDYIVGNYGLDFEGWFFRNEERILLFSPSAFTTPEGWDDFYNPNDRDKCYEIAASINFAEKSIIRQRFENHEIVTSKHHNGSKEYINQKKAISLLKHTTTFWGDTYENKQILFAFLRFFSALFTLLYVIFKIFIFTRHKKGKVL